MNQDFVILFLKSSRGVWWTFMGHPKDVNIQFMQFHSGSAVVFKSMMAFQK